MTSDNKQDLLNILKKYMFVNDVDSPMNRSGKEEIDIDLVRYEKTEKDFIEIKSWLSKDR